MSILRHHAFQSGLSKMVAGEIRGGESGRGDPRLRPLRIVGPLGRLLRLLHPLRRRGIADHVETVIDRGNGQSSLQGAGERGLRDDSLRHWGGSSFC